MQFFLVAIIDSRDALGFGGLLTPIGLLFPGFTHEDPTLIADISKKRCVGKRLENIPMLTVDVGADIEGTVPREGAMICRFGDVHCFRLLLVVRNGLVERIFTGRSIAFLRRVGLSFGIGVGLIVVAIFASSTASAIPVAILLALLRLVGVLIVAVAFAIRILRLPPLTGLSAIGLIEVRAASIISSTHFLQLMDLLELSESDVQLQDILVDVST
ncbi:MAG: hypothetical protein AAFX06_34380, partial [Planctomycetota bacterium]